VKLSNRVSVAATPADVFAALSDPARVVSCLPGASLHESSGNTHRGRVSVKVGPVVAAYEGEVTFLEVDAQLGALRLSAKGSDTHGNGDAEALVELRVHPHDGGSLLLIDTDLIIRGKLAQFGKNAIAVISERILGQFAANLQRLVTAGSPEGQLGPDRPLGVVAPPEVTADKAPTGRSEDRSTGAAELNAFDLLVRPVATKYGRSVALVGIGFAAGWLLGRAVTIERMWRSRA
jgi:carbon monoxide dehydrogenase subunit G